MIHEQNEASSFLNIYKYLFFLASYMYKAILITLVFFGVLFIIIEIIKQKNKCPEQKIIYKILPRTFSEEQDYPISITDTFYTMFSQPSPWISGLKSYDTRKQEQINKYFITQS